jgi:hypothetical protein
MRRKDLDELLPIDMEPLLNPGDYAKFKTLWVMRAPNGDLGTLRSSNHQIVEHEDGTITVSPSIQFETGNRYHGYLKAGIWS